jgi:hypothetical protein
MTLIRALPSLTDTERPRNASVREQLQQLEEVAREEIRELQQLADARPPRPGRTRRCWDWRGTWGWMGKPEVDPRHAWMPHGMA